MSDLTTQLADAIAGFCERLTPLTRLSTADVITRVWPHDPLMRKAAFSLLTRPPVALERYWTRGAEVKGKFGLKRPYLWHAPQEPCPCCNGTGRKPYVSRAPTSWEAFGLLSSEEQVLWAGSMVGVARVTNEDLEAYRAWRKKPAPELRLDELATEPAEAILSRVWSGKVYASVEDMEAAQQAAGLWEV